MLRGRGGRRRGVGVALLEAEPFDLVLLDVMMPGLNGLEVLRRIRATSGAEPLPVIMVTAKASPRVVERSTWVRTTTSPSRWTSGCARTAFAPRVAPSRRERAAGEPGAVRAGPEVQRRRVGLEAGLGDVFLLASLAGDQWAAGAARADTIETWFERVHVDDSSA